MVVLGLTAAFTVFLTVAMQCYYDFSYNKGIENTDDVYIYTFEYNQFSFSRIGLHYNEMDMVKQTYPEITDICALFDWTFADYIYCDVIKDDGTEIRYNDNARYAITNSFLNFFSPKIIAGNPENLFSEPDGAILTASYAKKLFGNENPVGKIIKAGNYYRGTSSLTVVAVWEDFPDNCYLKNGIYYDLGKGVECHSVYMKINKPNKSDLETLAKRLGRGEHLPEEGQERSRDFLNDRIAKLIPFDEIHFSKIGKGNLTTTLSLLFIGIIALIIAYINFVNFSIAVAPARVKSFNIRKIFGAQNKILRLVTASESAIFSLLAFLFATLCMAMLHENLPDDLFVADLSLTNNGQILFVTGIFSIIAGLIIGLYPAYYVTSFKLVLTLSGSPIKSRKNVYLRNILVSIQFTVCIALITVVVFMKKQHDYVVNYSYNMDTKNVIYMSTLYWGKDKVHNPELVSTFVEELKTSPQILDYATTRDLVGVSHVFTRNMKYNDAPVYYRAYTVGANLFNLLDIPIIEGTDFHNPISHREPVIVNKAFVESCGLSASDIIGKELDGDDVWNGVVVGVIDNINFEDLHFPVHPLAFTLESHDRKPPEWLLIKLSNKDAKTVAYLKSIWEKFSNKPFEYAFLDDYLASLYKKENDLAGLLTIVCIITIIIALMGVFGLITFNIRQKEKEIALRKICGARFKDILLLLNRGVLIQLAIAFVVATPVAYYIANRWLESFAYKISMHWWIFVLCWLLMCLIVIATIGMQVYRAATKNPVDAIKTE
jgi:putative ABC transport system permease protein